MIYLKENAGCISWCTRWERRPHAEKPLSTTLQTLSRGNLKTLMPRNFTFVCHLHCCSSKHNNNKTLRITFNSCKIANTYSMALAPVNIEKIIKVTSASSYVYISLSRISDGRAQACECLTYSRVLDNKLNISAPSAISNVDERIQALSCLYIRI